MDIPFDRLSVGRFGLRRALHAFPTRRSSDLGRAPEAPARPALPALERRVADAHLAPDRARLNRTFTFDTFVTGKANQLARAARSEEHTSELQSHVNLVCRLLLEKKKISVSTD